jgi:hypothetical protein
LNKFRRFLRGFYSGIPDSRHGEIFRNPKHWALMPISLADCSMSFSGYASLKNGHAAPKRIQPANAAMDICSSDN